MAVHLRAMNMLSEGLKQHGSLILVPSTAVDSIHLGAIGGTAGLAKAAGNGAATPPAGST